MDKQKVIICCIPLNWEVVPTQFFLSVALMQQYAAGRYIFAISASKAAYIDMMRYKALASAQKHSPDYLLWLDADQVYPMETPEILMKHIDSGKLVVGGITPHRADGKPLVYNIEKDGQMSDRKDIKPYMGMKKVEGMGLGGIMMNPKIFDTLDTECLQSSWHPELNIKMGEDLAFYANCKKHNIGVWCDTDLCFEHIVVSTLKFRKTDEKRILLSGV